MSSSNRPYGLTCSQISGDVEQGAKVLALFLNRSIDEQTPFASVRERTHALLGPERLQQLCRRLAGDGSTDEGEFEWQGVDGIMAKVKRNLRPLLRFRTPANTMLLETLATMVEAFERGEPLPALEVSTAFT